jgi:hypothetical protein
MEMRGRSATGEAGHRGLSVSQMTIVATKLECVTASGLHKAKGNPVQVNLARARSVSITARLSGENGQRSARTKEVPARMSFLFAKDYVQDILAVKLMPKMQLK